MFAVVNEKLEFRVFGLKISVVFNCYKPGLDEFLFRTKDYGMRKVNGKMIR